MWEVIHAKKPLFNSTQATLFEKHKATLTALSQSEIKERRYNEPTAKYIEVFISENLLDQWLVAKTRFIKSHYFWKAIEVVPPYNKFITFHSFMVTYYKKLWDDILLSARGNGQRKVLH